MILQLLQTGGHDHLVTVLAWSLQSDGNHYLVERLHSHRYVGSVGGCGRFGRWRLLARGLGQNCPHLLTGRLGLLQFLTLRSFLSGSVVTPAFLRSSANLPGVFSLYVTRLPRDEVLGLDLHHHLVHRHVIVEQSYFGNRRRLRHVLGVISTVLRHRGGVQPGSWQSLVAVLRSPLVLVGITSVLVSQVLRVRIWLVWLLLMHLSWLLLSVLRVMAGRVNVLRSVLTGITVAAAASSEKVATLRIVLWKLRLALALTPGVVGRVWRGEEVSVSEVCFVGHVVHVNSSL